MTNIIAHLRQDRPLSWEDRLEAADEITRLREENARLREESARLRELVVSAREENARLRNDNFEWLQQLSATNHQLEKEPKEIQKLRKTLIGVLAGFVASVDLLERGGKKAAPSDKMFAQMLDDYKNRIERGRAAVAAIRDSRNCVPEGGKVENQTKLD